MNKTAIIYSLEESRALPPEKRPICHRVTEKIYTAAHNGLIEAFNIGKIYADRPDRFGMAHLDLCFAVAEELERLGVTFDQINAQKGAKP